jgi:hypothetical protein
MTATAFGLPLVPLYAAGIPVHACWGGAPCAFHLKVRIFFSSLVRPAA